MNQKGETDFGRRLCIEYENEKKILSKNLTEKAMHQKYVCLVMGTKKKRVKWENFTSPPTLFPLFPPTYGVGLIVQQHQK